MRRSIARDRRRSPSRSTSPDRSPGRPDVRGSRVPSSAPLPRRDAAIRPLPGAVESAAWRLARVRARARRAASADAASADVPGALVGAGRVLEAPPARLAGILDGVGVGHPFGSSGPLLVTAVRGHRLGCRRRRHGPHRRSRPERLRPQPHARGAPPDRGRHHRRHRPLAAGSRALAGRGAQAPRGRGGRIGGGHGPGLLLPRGRRPCLHRSPDRPAEPPLLRRVLRAPGPAPPGRRRRRRPDGRHRQVQGPQRHLRPPGRGRGPARPSPAPS